MTEFPLINELRKWRSMLTNVTADNASPRLIAILDWLCKEVATKRIIESLVASVDQSKVFQSNRQGRIVARTLEERAFAGYALITNCRKHSFYRWCMQYDVRGPYRSSNINEITRAGITEYVEPFLDYVQSELVAVLSDTTSTSIIETRLSACLEEAIAAHLPTTSELMSKIASEFSRSDSDVHWQNVGNSCREALKSAIRELVEITQLTLPADVHLGNVKRIAELITSRSATSDSRGTLSKLTGAVWDHAQTVTHRDAITKEDALRLFVWTTLAISELVDLRK